MPNPKLSSDHVRYDAAMTFTEIGKKLGIERRLAFVAYVRALAKIKRNKRALSEFQQLVAYRQSLRKAPIIPDSMEDL